MIDLEKRTFMASGNKQPQWEIYEAVILLDGYLEWLHTNQPKSQAIRLDEDYAKGTIRISLGKYNTEEEIERIAVSLIKIVKI